MLRMECIGDPFVDCLYARVFVSVRKMCNGIGRCMRYITCLAHTSHLQPFKSGVCFLSIENRNEDGISKVR